MQNRPKRKIHLPAIKDLSTGNDMWYSIDVSLRNTILVDKFKLLNMQSWGSLRGALLDNLRNFK